MTSFFDDSSADACSRTCTAVEPSCSRWRMTACSSAARTDASRSTPACARISASAASTAVCTASAGSTAASVPIARRRVTSTATAAETAPTATIRSTTDEMSMRPMMTGGYDSHRGPHPATCLLQMKPRAV